MMKLFYSPIADLVHKVQVVAIEAGVYGRIERIPTAPVDRDAAHVAANPLSKVPTLVLEDGTALYGGPVIYEYLDSLHDGPKMFPSGGEERWTALRQMALGDGMFDIAALWAGEVRRPEEARYQVMIDRHAATVGRCLGQLEFEAPQFSGFTIGLISIAGGLMYLDRLRNLGYREDEWRDGYPALAAWYEDFVKRPSFQPHDQDFRAAWDAGDLSPRTGLPDSLRQPVT
jgi:glutathione S-transferase